MVVAIVVVGVAPAAQAVWSSFSRGEVSVFAAEPVVSGSDPLVDDVIVVLLDSFSGTVTLSDL